MIVDADDLFILDPKFRPCRDERCSIVPIHREHPVQLSRGRQCRRCPICNAAIIRIPRKHAKCSSCAWQITNPKPTKKKKHA